MRPELKRSSAPPGPALTTVTDGRVTVEPFDSLDHYWQHLRNDLGWNCLFMLPPWLNAWWASFGRDRTSRLCVVRRGASVIGIAPLMDEGRSVRLIGNDDLTDYGDFIVADGSEDDFFALLTDHLAGDERDVLDTGRLRTDSAAHQFLQGKADAGCCEILSLQAGALYEMELPDVWDGYFDLLSAKERHEVRRKLRRLDEAGKVIIRIVEAPGMVDEAMDTFIRLFRTNRRDKALFMTETTESYFRLLASETAGAGLLMLLFLDLNGSTIASTLCFDYHSTVYLYNNGYDRRFARLSPGLLSKVFTIRESIRRGRRRFSFLRGGEGYKRRLGGTALQLSRFEVRLR